MTRFLEWWVLFLVQISGLALCQYFGLFDWVWHSDKTKISFLIILIWLIESLICGRLAWQLSQGKIKSWSVEQRSETGWFWSDQCLSLGMLGTVIGFMIMIGTINVPSSADVAMIQGMLKTMSLGMSTALITTGAGMIFGNLIKIQYFLLTRET
jgi:hypothetical protein